MEGEPLADTSVSVLPDTLLQNPRPLGQHDDLLTLGRCGAVEVIFNSLEECDLFLQELDVSVDRHRHDRYREVEQR